MTTTPFMQTEDKISMFNAIETETKAAKRQAESFRVQNYISLLEDRIKHLESVINTQRNIISIHSKRETLTT